jgi:two-component system, chemotaxis family, sensor kinase CheA
VVLSAEQEGDHILLTISDDGKGMDPDVLRRKAVEKGLMDQDAAARMTDQDAFNVIFMAGFSTKTEISDVSGRGVGMDVVKTKHQPAQRHHGNRFREGPGQYPAHQGAADAGHPAHPDGGAGGQRFALPLANVSEIFDLDLSRTNHVDEQEVVMVRNQACRCTTCAAGWRPMRHQVAENAGPSTWWWCSWATAGSASWWTA